MKEPILKVMGIDLKMIMRQNKRVAKSGLPIAVTPETALSYFVHKRFKAISRTFKIGSKKITLLLYLGIIIQYGCVNLEPKFADIPCQSKLKINIDAVANEEVWQKATIYPLKFLPQIQQEKDCIFQSGEVRYLCDNDYLYFFAKVEDDDIVQYGKNNEDLCKRGDVLELFIRNNESGGYWEIHLAPNNSSTVLFYPNAGRRLFPEAFANNNQINLVTKISGTINNYQDKDNGYQIEAAIPCSIFGKDFPRCGSWSIMSTRYNYGKNFKVSQLSTTVKLPMVDFHLVNYYTPIKFRSL